MIATKKKIQVKNNLKIEVYDSKGKLVKSYEGSNLITTLGFSAMASRLYSNSGYNPFTYIAIGTGDTAPEKTDTALETEIDREVATCTLMTTDTTDDTLQMTYIFDISGDHNLTEAGVFNASSAGTMLARHTFSALSLLDGWQVKVIWRFDFDS
jgi:hypothetical protein